MRHGVRVRGSLYVCSLLVSRLSRTQPAISISQTTDESGSSSDDEEGEEEETHQASCYALQCVLSPIRLSFAGQVLVVVWIYSEQ